MTEITDAKQRCQHFTMGNPMKYAIPTWFLKLSIRWKLQLGFFMVTMVTTIYNRMLASHELGKMVEIARSGGVPIAMIDKLEANHHAYIINSFWESGIEFALQFIIIGFLAALFVKPILSLCDALTSVQQGDLTKGVICSSKDEIGQLETSFNDVLAKLSAIMREIHDSGKQMEQSAYQIAKISRDIAEVSNAEHRRTTDVNQATGQLQEISKAVQSHARSATDLASLTEERAQEGILKVQKNIAEMGQTVEEVNRASEEIYELEKAADKIHQIIGVIKTIADQTNLLSLNAAIEAARAGKQGRGFAVVADEVRKLADCTGRSASEVSELINGLSINVSQVTRSMKSVVGKVYSNQAVAGETENVIKAMVGEITETAKANQNISIVIAKQLDTLLLLKDTLDNLFVTLRESSNKVETTAAIGESLHGVAGKLNEVMSGFRFEQSRVVEPEQDERRNHPRAQFGMLVHATQGSLSVDGISKDFSITGMRLTLSNQLDKNENVMLDVFLPKEDLNEYERQAPLLIKGRIAWEKGDAGEYQYGIQFLECHDEATQRLKDCLNYFNRCAEFSPTTPSVVMSG